MNPLADKSHAALLVLVQEQMQTIAFLLQTSEALEQEIARLKGLKPGKQNAILKATVEFWNGPLRPRRVLGSAGWGERWPQIVPAPPPAGDGAF